METFATVEDERKLNFKMKKINPPKFALRFLRWFCPSELHEGIEGDLLEEFDEDVKEVGAKKASRRMFWNTLNFFRPSIILRNKFRFRLNNTIMIGNYFKVATRNIAKRKMYSFINAFGLSIGIAFCVLIYLYIQDERSFDQFHKNKNPSIGWNQNRMIRGKKFPKTAITTPLI